MNAEPTERVDADAVAEQGTPPEEAWPRIGTHVIVAPGVPGISMGGIDGLAEGEVAVGLHVPWQSELGSFDRGDVVKLQRDGLTTLDGEDPDAYVQRHVAEQIAESEANDHGKLTPDQAEAMQPGITEADPTAAVAESDQRIADEAHAAATLGTDVDDEARRAAQIEARAASESAQDRAERIVGAHDRFDRALASVRNAVAMPADDPSLACNLIERSVANYNAALAHVDAVQGRERQLVAIDVTAEDVRKAVSGASLENPPVVLPNT